MKTCPSCGAVDDSDNLLLNVYLTCMKCFSSVIAAHVPPEFRSTDLKRIGNLDSILELIPLKRGVVIHGAIGAGKTRAMWELLKVAWTANTKVFTPGKNSFDHQLAWQYKTENAERWIAEVCDADIVAFDDVTKMRMTERVESELFGVIDHRTTHHLPVIVTVQGDSTSISRAMGDDKSAPLIRRLREFCDLIQVYQSL